MTTWNKVNGTTTGEFGLGFTGPKITNVDGVLQVENSDGSALAAVTAASFTGDGANLSNVTAVSAVTVTDAAQPNITSTGTLTGLTVEGFTVLGGLTTVSGGDLYVGYDIDTEGSLRVEQTADFNGNVVANSAVTIKGVTTLGPVGNVKISGGTSGQLISTDGAGNLSFITPTSFTPFKYAREWHVSTDLGSDTTGDGSYEKPFKTIAKVKTTIGTGTGHCVYLHVGSYTEAVTWTNGNTDFVAMNDGGTVNISGAWDFAHMGAGSVRFLNGAFNAAVTHSGTGPLFFSSTNLNGAVNKTGAGYLELKLASEVNAAGSYMNITGAGQVVLIGGAANGVVVNNANAQFVARGATLAVLTVTAGVAVTDESFIYAATSTSNAVTTSAGSFFYGYNSHFVTAAGGLARVSFGGFWTMNDVQYDKANSTLTGTNIGTVSHFDALNIHGVTTLGAVGNVKISGGTSGQMLTTDGAGNLSFTTVASVANADYADIAGEAYSVAVANVVGLGNIATINLSANADLVLDGTGTWVPKDSGPQGPAGPQGETGATGPQGIQGQQGEQGVAGPQGDIGPQGPQGDVGPQGEQGAAGVGIDLKGTVATVADLPTTGNKTGDAWIVEADGDLYDWTVDNVWVNVGQIVGPQGPQGETGAVGPQGPQGVEGPQGIQGIEGPQGATGPQGETGPQGPQGDTGATGATGAKGDTGDVGPQGETGPQGPTGETGATGATGPQGETGPAGVGIATGGTTGQVLAKSSDSDYATTWVDIDLSGAMKMAEIAFAAADGSVTGPELPIGTVVDSVSVIVDTAFNGGATVAVTGFVEAGDSLLSQVGRYVVDQAAPALSAATSVEVVITNGSTTGSGRVIVKYAIPITEVIG